MVLERNVNCSTKHQAEGKLKSYSSSAPSSSTTSLLKPDEMKEFDLVYPKIIKDLINGNGKKMPGMMEGSREWLLELLEYNIVGGKKLRGIMVPATYKCMVQNPTPEDMELAYILGWFIEILQAASLVADDMVDESETRRGKPCWYKVEGVGTQAVRDYRLLISVAFRLLKVHFGSQPYFKTLWDCVIEVIWKTIFGQGLDCKMSKCEAENIQESFTMERYNAIVKYKTVYYTMYLPVALAMIMAGKGEDKDIMQKVESLLLEIGNYFQVQDDYLDCYGDEKETGKFGTDIQDNKCSWLVVQALELCRHQQGKLTPLKENYGRSDPACIARVKQVYEELDLKSVYSKYETEIQDKIIRLIDDLPVGMDKQVFVLLFFKIYQRRK